MDKFLLRSTAVVLLGMSGFASAAPISAISYDMVNGDGTASGGSWDYWDDSYSGSGNTTVDNSPLSGGLGDLTDGVIATDIWFVTESPAGPGPYVGWRLDPVITFNFAGSVAFNSITFHFDDSNGFGGVSPPASVDVNGILGLVGDPAGAAPFSYTLDLTGLSSNALTVSILRSNEWVFLSEVTFDGDTTAAPAPATLPLLSAALGLLALSRKRKLTT